MPLSFNKKIASLALLLLVMIGCVDQIESGINAYIDIIVVDGRLTNLAEEQVVRINRSKAEYGLFGSLPISNAVVELVVNNSMVIAFTEKNNQAGEYILPAGFKAKIGDAYQLRIKLADGRQYESTIQVMPKVPAIEKVSVRFNAEEPFSSKSAFKGVHSFYLDTKDPVEQENFYSWEWTAYEKKKWCRTCQSGVYVVNEILPGQYRFSQYYVSGDKLFEDCFTQPTATGLGVPAIVNEKWNYDYKCRTECWEIIHNEEMNLFDDRNINGGQIQSRKIARLPYYQFNGALVEIRQASLTKDAYQFYRFFQEQTRNNGGIADTPPTALKGNIRNINNDRENVVGFFTVSAVSSVRYWLDRKDTGKLEPPGLFEGMNERNPSEEPLPPEKPYILIWGGPPRVPTATCLNSATSTPEKPVGWIGD